MFQRDLILKKDWKVLIILDACRYDTFAKIYPSYLKGNLQKVISPASYTLEWLMKTWKGKHEDVVYVSGNPFISSKNANMGKFFACGSRSFRASEHFYKVIDAWLYCWDDELGTVHPSLLTTVAEITYNKFPEKKMVVHYIQPHEPFLGIKIERSSGKLEVVKKRILNAVFKVFGDYVYSMMYRMWSSLGLDTPYHSKIIRKYGRETLIKAYEDNLRLVLRHVKDLVRKLDGKIVITSDHGELLGEHGLYGHPPHMKYRELIEVPWLEIF